MKIIKLLKKFSSSIVIAGVIILVIGLCYAMFKAGIPYQDPPMELQIQYTVDSTIGSILSKMGFVLMAGGAAAWIIFALLNKKSKNA